MSIVVLVVALVVGSGAPAVLAAGNASVSASPNTAGSTATHTVMMEVANNVAGSSLDHIDIYYGAGSNPADVSNVGVEDVIRFGVDRDADGDIDDSAMGGSMTVSASNNGNALTIQNTSGPTNLEEGDVIIAEYKDVQNPDSKGVYDVQLELNGADTAQTSYQITSDSTATATPTPTPTATPTPTPTDSGNETPTPTPTDSGTGNETPTPTPTASESGGGGDGVFSTPRPTATPTATETPTETTVTETATPTETPTATATDGEAQGATDATTSESPTPTAQQRLTEPEPNSSGIDAVKAAVVLVAALLAGAIWLLKLQS
ncbi:MAG: hypothetical protein ABEH90_08840 [Halolamina sp.]